MGPFRKPPGSPPLGASPGEKARLELKSRSFWTFLILAVVYAGAAKLALMLAVEHPSATAVWPPTGIALAASLVLGYGVWPGIFAGAFLANITTAGSAVTSVGIAIGNTLEAVVGAYLVTRFANGRAAFDRPPDVLKFAGLAGLLSTMVSATCGVSTLALAGHADWAHYGSIWLTWWLGDAGGALIVAPALLLWSAAPAMRWSRSRGPEALLAFLSIALSGGAVFGRWLPLPVQRLQSLTLPALVWVAFRFGPREAATATLLLSGIALVGTMRGLGPFGGAPPQVALRSLQVYASVISVTALVLAAAVSERRRLEEERVRLAAERARSSHAERSEARVRALLDSAPDATVVVDQEGRIVFVNAQTETVFGYTRAELTGESVEVLVPEHSRPRHTRHREAYVADARVRPMGAGLDLYGRRRDGTEFPVEISLSPIRTEEGVLTSAAIRDVSERKQAEEARARLAAIVESSGDAIISEALDGTILTWNPGAERIYGYSADEVAGRSASLLVPPGHEGDMLMVRDRLSRGERLDSYETMRRTKDGRVIEVSVSFAPIRDATGRVTGISVVARDITEKRRIESALREANEDLEAFTYSVSHDLRAPLRGLRGLAQALLDDYGPVMDEAAREYARRVESTAARMDALTENLLGYSRLGYADVPLNPVELDAVAAEALAQLESEIRARDAQISVPVALPVVVGHHATLTQIVSNLVSNAIKFVGAGVRPEVVLRTEERGGWVRVWVIDNGIGIEPAYHERIFQGFERLHDATAYSGHGLGLAIVRKGIVRMGGQVGVESEVGRGSRFWFELRREQG